MMLAARIDLADAAADLLEQQAINARLAHTPAPHHQWATDDNSSERAAHDRLVLVAAQMRRMSWDMRGELDHLERITGRPFQARSAP